MSYWEGRDSSHWQGSGGASKAREPAPKPEYFKAHIALDTVIKVYTADITRLEVDAVVNAANENLKLLGGVSAALLSAAGPQLQDACNQYLRERGTSKLPVGEAVHTAGFRLKARYVIHAVGPDGNEMRSEPEFRRLLELAILNTFREAQALHVGTLALPLISGGIFAGHFGKHVASEVLWQTVVVADQQLGTLRELHLVNNDPSVTRSLLQVAHSPAYFRELISPCGGGDR